MDFFRLRRRRRLRRLLGRVFSRSWMIWSALLMCHTTIVQIVSTDFESLPINYTRLDEVVNIASLEQHLDRIDLSGSHDPRLVPVLWVHQLQHSFHLPFSWNSLLPLHTDFNGDCDLFASYSRLHENITEACADLDTSFEPKLTFSKLLFPYTSAEAAQVVGHSYLLHQAPNPLKICFLNVYNGSSLLVPVSRSDYRYTDVVLSLVYVRDAVLPYISLLQTIHSIQDLDFPGAMILSERQWKQPELEDFVFDQSSLDAEALQNVQHAPSSKYFHEVSVYGTSRGAHFDARFFSGFHYTPYETRAILQRLTHAWLKFASAAGLTSWLAHGTLLGWWWNKSSFPWDQDLDIQMTMASLCKLAEYNQTLVVNMDMEEGVNTAVGNYLIDVSPTFVYREKGDGNNLIDARFIDTATGFYVDITGLAFTNSSAEVNVKSSSSNEINQLLDPQFLVKKDSSTIEKEDLYESLRQALKDKYNHRNLFNCRNNHFYSFDELSLIETTFEGVSALVPKDAEAILKREYKKGVFSREFNGYKFLPVLKQWVPKSKCRSDRVGDRCFDREVLLQAKHTNLLDPWVVKKLEEIKSLT